MCNQSARVKQSVWRKGRLGASIDNRARGNGLETVTCAALLSVLTSNIRSSYPRFRYVLARNEQLCCLLRFVYYAKT